MSRRPTPAEREEIARRIGIRRLYSTENLMAEFDCSRGDVSKIAATVEVPTRPRGRVGRSKMQDVPQETTNSKMPKISNGELDEFVERVRQLS